MLILGLRVGESLMVGDDVEVTFTSFKGGIARMGITAPRVIAVHRKSIYLRIQAEQEQKAK